MNKYKYKHVNSLHVKGECTEEQKEQLEKTYRGRIIFEEITPPKASKNVTSPPIAKAQETKAKANREQTEKEQEK